METKDAFLKIRISKKKKKAYKTKTKKNNTDMSEHLGEHIDNYLKQTK